MLSRIVRLRPAWIVLATCMLAALPATATAARLIGGRQQMAVARAFSRQAAHKGQLIVSIRASSIASSWTVVKSVRAEGGGSRTAIRLRSSFFHRTGSGQHPGTPPSAVARDLKAPFRVAIVYSGSGSESVTYSQAYRTVCSGGGGFIEQESAAVGPISFSVRYVVDLDRVLAAVRSSQGTTIVPSVSFDGAASHLAATERLSRSYVDQGCFSRPTNYHCVRSFSLNAGGAGSDLALDPGHGTEIALPMRSAGAGDCAAEYYTLGPSLWDSGAASVLVPGLGLVDGRLPGNPYAPQRVQWPVNSALAQQGFLASPCQSASGVCTDSLHLRGAVRLQTISTG